MSPDNLLPMSPDHTITDLPEKKEAPAPGGHGGGMGGMDY